MGWVRKTPQGRYRGSYRDPEGKTVSKTFDKKGNATTPGTAEWWVAKHGVAQADGDYVDPRAGRKPVSELWEEFVNGSTLRPSTLATYRRHWRLYLEQHFGHKQLGAVRTPEIRAWRAELHRDGVGASTIRAATKLGKTLWQRAVDDELIGRNPWRGVKNPSTDPEGGLNVLEAAEVVQLADTVPDRYRALVLLLGFRGPRISEAVALRVGDFDPMRGRLAINKAAVEVDGIVHEGETKTEAGRRTLTLPSFLRDGLVAHLEEFGDPRDPTAHIFTTATGVPVRAGNFRKRVFQPAAREIGLMTLTVHDTRDTAATLAFAAGATIREVQQMLGHADPAVTLRRYAGVLDSQVQRTDAALDAAFRELSPSPAGTIAAIGATGS